LNDIVEFHALEAELTRLDLADNDMNEVVADVRDTMMPLLAEKKNIKFDIDVYTALPKARFDRERIALVLTNIENIAINTTEKGEVIVRTRREGDNAIRVAVDDTGSTIDKEHLPTLFDKFDRPGKDRDKKAGGSGLGLTISREIIKKHNGKIWAEERKGGGVTISFVLPLGERRG
jgi:signal transduction histidine kinase